MKKIALLLTVLLIVNMLYSRRVETSGKGGGTTPTPTAGCAVAVDKATLSLNNVRTRIEGTGGSMWQDRSNSIADYEIPKRNNSDDPKYTSIYAGALWLGGQDKNGQIKVAAVTFRTGNDFWPGPLTDGPAETDPNTCSVFDQSFGISRAMVEEFNAWYLCYEDPLCDDAVEYPGYSIPDEIKNYPAKGNQVKKGNATYFINEALAPFEDRDKDGYYDPTAGDYPRYDLVGEDCKTTRAPKLYGDTTIWFVFNDKGNVHSESQGPSIGMEIRGQAFAFATNDEINNMTFYNYELINRSSFTFEKTYFGQWVDADLGGSTDDFVGCDAQRGLGYCYNGLLEDKDDNGVNGYGLVPPAVGVDFFEGPYMDDDQMDNPLTQIVQDALDSNGIPYEGLGIGYGDGIVDNERYGMRKFVYYSIGGGQFSGDGDPGSALDYYNYLRGRWRFGGAQMVWGGNGNAASSGGTVLADLLFPGDSDPLFWSTQGVAATPSNWSEFNEGNPPGDRRFLQSAGPFTLEPGNINNLTVGVVWARATSGDNWSSVQSLRVADDKAQALFDNCFKMVDGPDAPDLNFQELDKELILYLTNRKASNNYNETFYEKNPFLGIPDTLDGVYYPNNAAKDTLKFYSFQGYKIYQVKNGLITVGELDDPSKAILVAQVDIKDDVKDIINYEEQEFTVGGGQAPVVLSVPKQMVQAENAGIRHSFRITKDAFASGDGRLVNHKTYYFMAIAYAHNEYKKFDPDHPLEGGNMLPYLASRKMAGGQGITSFAAIPHNPSPENGGTLANSAYGDMPEITRKEGQGNGGNILELTDETEATIVANHFSNDLVYESGYGPIQVKVIDPLNVQAGVYTVQFKDTITSGDLNDAFWTLHLPNGVDKVDSDQLIDIENEQLILKHGLSITIGQVDGPGFNQDLGNGVLSSEIEYADPSLRWLSGFSDQEGQTDGNWIRSGTSNFDVGGVEDPYNDYDRDPEQFYEGMINGTWSPYALVSSRVGAGNLLLPNIVDVVGYSILQVGTSFRNSVYFSDITKTPSVDIVFTSDRNKWSRCVVLESRNDVLLAEGGVAHLQKRSANSVDKYGNDDGTGTGMGWFPGYAINVETGERLNMAFAEDSWLAGENGRDMKWNPTSTMEAGVPDFPGGPLPLIMGGKHYVYVFRSNISKGYPAYDECHVIDSLLSLPVVPVNIPNAQARSKVFEETCVWAGIPMLEDGHTLLETDAKVKLRVEKPYERFYTDSINNELPYYQFDMTGMEVELGNANAMDSALAMINVVPNPYYAYSEYESSQLDKRIKITNLPEECTISIYNINGTLMRRFQKGDPKTSLDWDLNNHVNIPIASGVYLIHVKVPDVGERTLKWYGVMKPTDLNGF